MLNYTPKIKNNNYKTKISLGPENISVFKLAEYKIYNPICSKGGAHCAPLFGFLKSVKNWDGIKARFFATFSYI